ncbi:general transcription factor II-I repeat domain-containing protein 2 [Nephila pilipes]|uniref:General transcription factor II-I repeat domain-containing protein 2 n=1 Tax=Nephila pilipes TaxID=299642 RepID=A0A8X6NE99_NEPPI|nr:general transcription factor II-I repeat domain-containing protein 2 [Nephila pilipes]
MCFRASFVTENGIVSFSHEKQCSPEYEMLEDTEWLSDFAFFMDLLCHMSNLNVKMQGKNHLIDDIWAHLKAFKLKLNQFAGQLVNNNLSHFPRKCSTAFDGEVEAIRIAVHSYRIGILTEATCPLCDKRNEPMGKYHLHTYGTLHGNAESSRYREARGLLGR